MTPKYKIRIVQEPDRYFLKWHWSIRRDYSEVYSADKYIRPSLITISAGYDRSMGDTFTYAQARRKAIKAARIMAQKDLNDEDLGESFTAYELFRPEAEIAPERNPRKILERLNQLEIEEWSREFDRIKEKQNV